MGVFRVWLGFGGASASSCFQRYSHISFLRMLRAECGPWRGGVLEKAAEGRGCLVWSSGSEWVGCGFGAGVLVVGDRGLLLSYGCFQRSSRFFRIPRNGP